MTTTALHRVRSWMADFIAPEAEYPPAVVAAVRQSFAAVAASYPSLNQSFDCLAPKSRRRLLAHHMKTGRRE